MFWIDEPEGGTNRLYAIDPPFRTVMPSTRGPENFETEIVVNTSRIKMLNGDICHGCNVDMSKGPEDRNLKIRYAEPQAKTTIEFNETFLQRLLRPMPIPNNSEVEVKFWDRKIRCMRSG
jgi:hypothetical protein